MTVERLLRAEIYVCEDWEDEQQVAKMLQQVEWALLPKDHNWLQQLQEQDFTVLESAGGVLLLESPNDLAPPGHLTPQ